MFFAFCFRISRYYHIACEEYAQNAVKGSINQEINEILVDKLNIQSEREFVKIEKNETGKIIGIIANSAEINKLSLSLANDIQSYLSFQNQSYGIPLGNITGYAFFSGIGPKIKTRVVTVGSVYSELVSEIKESGINQTLYRLILNYKTEATNIAPFNETKIIIENSIIIFEILIVGEIPSLIV